jgi:hypothetical protein
MGLPLSRFNEDISSLIPTNRHPDPKDRDIQAKAAIETEPELKVLYLWGLACVAI